MPVLRMQKAWNSTCYFSRKFPIVRKQESLDFERIICPDNMWIISGNLCQNKDSKTLEIQDNVSPKKSLEIQPPLWGEGKIFLE